MTITPKPEAAPALVALREAASRTVLAGDLRDDTFKRRGRVHDWRTHVPESIRRLWPLLNESERLAAALVAQDVAEAEEWD